MDIENNNNNAGACRGCPGDRSETIKNCLKPSKPYTTIGLSSSDFVPNDQRSARNRMAIARMPEDCSKTVNNL
eukprot:6314387-Heterocapsa_arctica.AAC.1